MLDNGWLKKQYLIGALGLLKAVTDKHVNPQETILIEYII